jgi:hypothetical protein
MVDPGTDGVHPGADPGPEARTTTAPIDAQAVRQRVMRLLLSAKPDAKETP